MLSAKAGCYNADGLKVDGTTMQPYGYDMQTHGDLYGFELQKHGIRLIYEAAHAAKQDALVSLFIANPYFHEITDMVRLGDLYSTLGDPVETMRTRARIVNIAMPGVPIDTDGALRFCMRADYRTLLAEQVRLGIPTIYNAELLMRVRTFTGRVTRKMSSEDYRVIAEAMRDYERRLAEECTY